MELPNVVKRIPRWAWLTTGGIVIGAGAIRLYQNRTTDISGEEESTTESLPVDEMGGYGYGTGSVSPSGVIVPPVIIGGGENTGDPGLGELSALYMSGLEGVFAAYSDIFGNVDTYLQSVAEAGSAPAPAANVDPVVTPVPTAPPAPAPAPPIVISRAPQPTTPQPETCRDKFPNYPHHNERNGPPRPKSCFKKECKRGERVHVYKDGHKVKMGDKCKD